MKVGLVIYDSLQTLSGGYIYDRKLVEHLRVNGDRVKLFSIPWRSYSRHLMDNLRSHWLNSMARARLDVLLQDELNHPSLFVLNRRLRPRVSCPIISIVHHLRSWEQWPLPVRPLYRAVERRYLASVDGFVFNSQATRQSVEELLGRGAPSVIAYPGGDRLGPPLEEEEIVARVRQGGPLRLTFVGNLIPRKGLDGLLGALAALRSEAWELTVAGSLRVDLDYAAKIRRSIAALGLEDKVRLLGSLPDPELARILKRSDVIAMPFSYEGFGIVYLEGMAYGLPALACRSGGAREIVTHRENGYLFEPGDLVRFAAILCRLIKNQDELLNLSLAARRRFAQFPTWEHTTAKIRDFMLEITFHARGVKDNRL
ncbi:MAG: glycosyltransferase family 4 protein [Syntrophobacteria bacterium]|jgi:glycosyltransferase involved in cell wall biosynthesis